MEPGMQMKFLDGTTHQITKANSNQECKVCGTISYLIDGCCTLICSQENHRHEQVHKERE